MFVRLLGNLLLNRMNIPLRRSAFAAHRCPPSKGELLAHEERVVLVRLFAKLFVNPINIPLRRFAFARCGCPLRRGHRSNLGLAPVPWLSRTLCCFEMVRISNP